MLRTHPESRARSLTKITAAVIGFGLLAGCSSGANSDSSTSDLEALTVATSPGSIPGLPALVASEHGFFEEHGFDAEVITSLRGGTALMSGLTSGSVDITAQTVSAAAMSQQKGARTPIVASLTAGVPYVLVVGNQLDAPIATDGPDGWQDTIKALEGATVAAGGAGSAFDTILKALFVETGLPADSYSNINLSHGGPELAGLQTNQVEAVFADIGTALMIEKAGAGKAVMRMYDQGPEWMTLQAWSGFMTTPDFETRGDDSIERFQAVLAQTREYMQDPANRAEIKRIAVEVSGIPDSPGLEEALAEYSSLITDHFTPEQIQATIDFMTRTGQLQAEPVVRAEDVTTVGVVSD